MEKKGQSQLVYMSGADFLLDATSCNLSEELSQKLDEEASKTILDEMQLRTQEAWSILANQVVGAEHLIGRSQLDRTA